MKKEAILNSTLELTSSLGIHNTPMSKIAQHSGVAVGTIYHHYNSKDEILNELYLQIQKEFGECLKAVLNKYSVPEEVFSQAFRIVYLYYTKNPLKFIFVEQIRHTPIITETSRSKAVEYYQPMVAYLQEQVESGKLSPISVELLGQLYYGNIRTLVQMKLSGNYEVDEEMLETAIYSSWKAFRRD